jgi:hypothetical protein
MGNSFSAFKILVNETKIIENINNKNLFIAGSTIKPG